MESAHRVLSTQHILSPKDNPGLGDRAGDARNTEYCPESSLKADLYWHRKRQLLNKISEKEPTRHLFDVMPERSRKIFAVLVVISAGLVLGGTQVETRGGEVRYLKSQPPKPLADLEMTIQTTLGFQKHSSVSTQTYALLFYCFIFAASILHHSRRDDRYQNSIAAASLLAGLIAAMVFDQGDLLPSSVVRWSPITLAVGLLISAMAHNLARYTYTSRSKGGGELI